VNSTLFFSIFPVRILKKYKKNRLRGFAPHFQISHFGKISHKIKTLLWIDMNNFKERGPTTNIDYFFPIVGCGTGNHLRGDFATSCYIPGMKVNNLENSFYIAAICFNNV
jgi:hypothetical protein